jgi:hypothetical protein
LSFGFSFDGCTLLFAENPEKKMDAATYFTCGNCAGLDEFYISGAALHGTCNDDRELIGY